MSTTKITDDNIYSVNSTKITGEINASCFPAVLPAISGANLTNLPGAALGFKNISGWADGETQTISLTSNAGGLGKAAIQVWEEIADPNKTNADWDITTNDSGFDLTDSAYAQTLTPAATTGDSVAFTLDGGSWVAADIGKRIVNVSTSETGEARILSIAGAVATCIITTAFTDTNAIASGDWELYTGDFDADGKFALSNATIAGGASIGAGLEFESNNVSFMSSCTIDTDKVLAVYQSDSNYKGYAVIITNTNGVLTYSTPVQYPGNAAFYYNDIIALSTTQAITVFRSENSVDTGGACVINISGTTITFGSVHNFTSAHYFGYCSLDKLSSTKAICSWAQQTAPHGTDCIVLSVSGNTVSSGSIVRLSGTVTPYHTDTVALSSSKFMTTWTEGNDTKGCVGTISGTTITKGTEQVIRTGSSSHTIELLTSSSVVLIIAESNALKTCYITISGTVMTINAETMIFAVTSGQKSLAYISATQTALAYADNINDTIKANRFCILTHSGTTITAGDPISIGNKDANVTLTGFATSDATEFAYIYKGDVSGTGKGEVRLVNTAGATTVSPIPNLFENADTRYTDVAALDATTGVIVYRDQDNSNYATAIHYTTNLTTRITTYGTPLVFNTASSANLRVDRLTATKVIAVIMAANEIFSYVISASGTTLTAGGNQKPSDLNSSGGTSNNCDVCALSSTQALVVWAQAGSSGTGNCTVLNISGTTHSLGTLAQYQTGGTMSSENRVAMLSSTKAIVSYGDNGNSGYFTACVLDVSGNTVTPGAEQVIDNGGSAGYSDIAKITSTKAICSYVKSNNPYMRILTISGTTVTAGTAVEFYTPQVAYHPKLAVLSETEAFISYSYSSGEYQLIDISTTTPVVGTRNRWIEDQAYEISTCTLYGSTTDAIVTYQNARTGKGESVILSKVSAPLYVSSQYVTTISGTDSIDTSNYVDLNSMTVTETLNGGTANFAFSTNSTPSSSTVTGGTFFVIGSGQTTTRDIASSLNSVHGGTEGEWYINNNTTYGSSTWVAAATNETKEAISEATAITANQMSGTTVNAVTDTSWPALGTQLSVAITLYSTDNSSSPTVDGISFNYDGAMINRDRTGQYVIEMPSVSSIKVTAPSSGGPRNARVYINS